MRRNPDNREVGVAQGVVMDLVEPLLDNGRTVYVDNGYNSVSLTHALNARSTHLIGTLRRKRRGNAAEV